MSSELATLESKAKKLDEVANNFANKLQIQDTPFSSALVLSNGISALRELLDDRMMREIMKLADSPLGFMTDQKERKAGAYKLEEVRDAIIEAGLRGFRVAGNEFNIIASRFYAAKNGLHRKVINYPGVTDFKENLGVPRFTADKSGAVVSTKATWAKDGIKDQLERDLAIRVNAYMGVDAILGKAQRKLYAAVLHQLSGIATPEGEVGDAETKTAETKTEPAKPEIDNANGEATRAKDQIKRAREEAEREAAEANKRAAEAYKEAATDFGPSSADRSATAPDDKPDPANAPNGGAAELAKLALLETVKHALKRDNISERVFLGILTRARMIEPASIDKGLEAVSETALSQALADWEEITARASNLAK
jgi:hypothetical protein